MKSTHHNNELRIANCGEKVALRGWVSKVRNLGGLLFIDLRDREGITQLLVRPDNEYYKIATDIRNEFVIYITGKVIERESKNSNILTGEIEIEIDYLEILNTANTTPLIISDETDALEDVRMKYRYLDLRRPVINNSLRVRSKITQVIRNYFYDLDFTDVETPMLGKSTPEGARDYLVPSRVHVGEFYALPQSPQIYKQLLMIGGIEKYFQITKCFRDEDLRADRQPEFTQLDVEVSFITEDEIIEMTNNLFKKLFKEILNYEFDSNVKKITYQDAMNIYGSDKPDLRFEMTINDVTNVFKKSEFIVFKSTIESNNVIRCIVGKNCANKFSRKDIENLEKKVKVYGPKGLAWTKFEDDKFTGGIFKFLSDEELNNLKNKLLLEENDIIFFVADSEKIAATALGFLRVELANILNLIDPNVFAPLWVVDFPLFEYDEDLNRYFAAHHPFTAPKVGHENLLKTDPSKCLARAYDFVINGYEIGGGSIRISNQNVQTDMFEALGFTTEEAYNQFGFFIDALKYGTPPHGGIACGIDRITMILNNTTNIKDVIAFPKTQNARCSMMDAPNTVDEKQLEELKILINLK